MQQYLLDYYLKLIMDRWVCFSFKGEELGSSTLESSGLQGEQLLAREVN